MKNKEKHVRRLSKFSLTTLIAVYFLILVGGIVRSTGSGMGCPDWPKCFGQWTPPTELSQLPENYKEIYSAKRHKKNVRFAKYLSVFGFNDTADQLINDQSIKEEADFNKYKTWTEYINRLVGVLIGLFIIATFVYSIPFLKTNKTIFIVALSTLVLVVFQGWIGSVVVSTNLLPWLITIHMFIALIIVALLVYLVYKTNPRLSDFSNMNNTKLLSWLMIFCMVIVLIQIAFGTQVREGIDVIANAVGQSERSNWVSQLGMDFIIHRSFSWVILIAHITLLVVAFRKGIKSTILSSLAVIIGLSLVTGIVLAYAGFPAAIQPVHLLLGTLTFGIQFLLFLQLQNSKSQLTEVSE